MSNNTKNTALKPASKAAGFTLVELLVTIVVAATFMGSLSLVVSSSARVSQRGQDLTIANAYVEQKIEAVRSAGYLNVNNGTTDLTAELPAELKAPRSASQVVTSYSDTIKQVVITVTYSDQGQPRTYSYSALLGELGVGQY